ncbi:MAG: hypothetical protein CUN49_04740 [Candidatus Thermofonsia Clade 1 bacterium]|jgi:hypothetical protein|uniref:Uncharacterized protein n=1 Tax=Candidatus Thermofonsia Clade 1 bacterium TaxID=2364210 RepID=A0A2M8PG98_9CHLR|nr:MAG: hypothetical protein CUN49_04740 [Candidatus Thermofonsia Clade 1 bacterium]RMF49286.1 MAG: hypothetical protein D6749_13585 [Chloroflexota bacterium]
MTDEAVAALILRHVQRYVAMDILDVYKLLHQGVFGAGHAISNQRAAREWLEKECAKLTPNAAEPLIESVHPNDEIVRVNLRPYLARHGSLKKLLDAFIHSAAQPRGDPETMAHWWEIFHSLTLPNKPLANRFAERTVALIGRTRAAEKWSATQHSPPYDQTHKPAYRVLDLATALELAQSQKMDTRIV